MMAKRASRRRSSQYIIRCSIALCLFSMLVFNVLTFPGSFSTDSSSPHRESWSSPHLVDCRAIMSVLEKEYDDGLYKQTLTKPSFLMSIYDPQKDEVSKNIHDAGCWECRHVQDMLTALSQYDDSYFLDIGGNIGMWSLAAAAAGYRTFTIEPLFDNQKRFCRSVDKNSFHDRTHLIKIAATSEPDNFRFNVPQGNVGGTSVISVGNNSNDDDHDIVRGVPVDTLNLPMDQPVVMKVDVEGHELQALLGAKHFLQNADIVYAAMELRSNLDKDDRWKELFDILASKGLKPFRINYEDETQLDINQLDQWKHFKHPIVRYYDVVWRNDDLFPGRNVTKMA